MLLIRWPAELTVPTPSLIQFLDLEIFSWMRTSRIPTLVPATRSEVLWSTILLCWEKDMLYLPGPSQDHLVEDAGVKVAEKGLATFWSTLLQRKNRNNEKKSKQELKSCSDILVVKNIKN